MTLVNTTQTNNDNLKRNLMADCQFKIPIQLKEAIQRSDGQWVKQISVPCGKCWRCIERRKQEWTFRMMDELENSKTAYFVTLTYDNENVPYTNYGLKTLLPHKDVTHLIKKKGRKRRKRVKVDHMTDYFKRLRAIHERSEFETKEHCFKGLLPTDKIKYYYCGEYGEQRGRPHYHAIIFNASERHIAEAWGMGNVVVIQANEQNIAYTMKYLDKWVNTKQDWKKTPEFNQMSEGIGLHFLEKMTSWYKANLDVLYVRTRKGILIPMPRYYRLRIWDEPERLQQVLIVEERIAENKAEEILEIGEEQYYIKQKQLIAYGNIKSNKNKKKRNVD